MNAYIINLESSSERRKIVSEQLSKEVDIKYEFVPAVDGRKLSDKEKNELFDINKAEKFYARDIKSGEVGCTLSHQKCYKKLLDSTFPYVIIFEDDIRITDSISNKVNLIKDFLDTNIPTVILLSGRFYYTKKIKIDKTILLGKVIDAYLSHAYIVNRAAAKILVEDYPWFMADNWKYFHKKGIPIYGFIPHLVDQNREIPSEIMDASRKFGFRGHYFSMFIRRLWHLIFNICGHYEKASNTASDFLTQYT